MATAHATFLSTIQPQPWEDFSAEFFPSDGDMAGESRSATKSRGDTTPPALSVSSVTPVNADSNAERVLWTVSETSSKERASCAAVSGADDVGAQIYTGKGCAGLHEWPSTTAEKEADMDKEKEEEVKAPITSTTARVLFVIFSAITVVAVAHLYAASAHFELAQSDSAMFSQRDFSFNAVWSAGWITAVSTGLGVLPFVFFSNVKQFWLGACNALACGMMAAASLGLLFEAVQVQEEHHMVSGMGAAWLRAALGAALGYAFIVATEKVLHNHEDLEFSGLAGASATKMLVIVVVMTVHSMAEGIGIGVSFAGQSGGSFGMFISTTLAIHNVPEGLAICLVLVPRGVGLLEASMWAVISSLPQPIFALPAFVSVNTFLPFLPVGLGFAAGAMLYVAFFELLPEALDDISKKAAFPIAAAAAICMATAQYALHE